MTPDQFDVVVNQMVGQFRQLCMDKKDRILQALKDQREEIGESGKVVLALSHRSKIDESTAQITDTLSFGVRDTSSLICKMIDPNGPGLFDGDTAERAPLVGEDD